MSFSSNNNNFLPSFDESSIIEDSFRQFEELRRKKQKTNGLVKKENIEAEGKVLRDIIVLDFYNNKRNHFLGCRDQTEALMQASNILFGLESKHQCTSMCNMKSFNKGMLYSTKLSERWIASGIVLCCNETGKIHLCGVDNCLYAKRMPKGEGLVCTITGRFLAKEYSLGNTRFEEDVRIVGNLSFKQFPTSDEGSNAWKSKSIPDQLCRACKSRPDALYILSTMQGSDFKEMKKAAVDRFNRRRHAESVWHVKIMSEIYEKQLKEQIRQAETQWKKHVLTYYNNCAKKRIKADRWRIEQLFLEYALPAYKGLYYGIDDIKKVNNQRKTYYVECMLRIWEKLSTLNYAKSNAIKFSDCAVAILNALSTGLQVTVYIKNSCKKPQRASSLTKKELENATSRQVIFINKHNCLILAPTNTIRRNNPPKSTKRIRHINNMTNGRRAHGCKNISKTTRKQRSIAQRIPSDKVLKQLYSALITTSTTIEDLYSYSLDRLIDVMSNRM